MHMEDLLRMLGPGEGQLSRTVGEGDKAIKTWPARFGKEVNFQTLFSDWPMAMESPVIEDLAEGVPRTCTV